jgi:hypothetical protein
MQQPADALAESAVHQAPSRGGDRSWASGTSTRTGFWQSLLLRPPRDISEEQGQAVTRILLAALGTLLLFAARQLGQRDLPFLLALAYLLASV